MNDDLVRSIVLGLEELSQSKNVYENRKANKNVQLPKNACTVIIIIIHDNRLKQNKQ